MPIWSDSFLSQLSQDAEQQINSDALCIWFGFSLSVTTGVSVYTLPSYVKTVTRVTWRGWTLDAVNWEELTLLSPATVFISPGNSGNIETSQGRPLYYAMHPTNPYDIRLYPTPGETLSGVGIDPYSPTVNQAACVVYCYRISDDTAQNPLLSLPPYIDRRTRKAYVLWKAFEAEGKGQNINAANFYKKKYQFLIDRFVKINQGCYVGKKYSLGDGMLNHESYRYPKPILPADFERVTYD